MMFVRICHWQKLQRLLQSKLRDTEKEPTRDSRNCKSTRFRSANSEVTTTDTPTYKKKSYAVRGLHLVMYIIHIGIYQNQITKLC